MARSQSLILCAAFLIFTVGSGCVGEGSEESMLDDDRADGMGLFPNEEVLVQGDPIYICDPEVRSDCPYSVGSEPWAPIEMTVVDFNESTGQILIETQDIRVVANTRNRILIQDPSGRFIVEGVVGFRAWYSVVSTDGSSDWFEVPLPESAPDSARWANLVVSPAFGTVEATWTAAGETDSWFTPGDLERETVEFTLPELSELSRVEGAQYIEYRLEIIPALQPENFERRTYVDELQTIYY